MYVSCQQEVSGASTSNTEAQDEDPPRLARGENNGKK